MILSRLTLNPMHPATYRLVGDPYGIHIKLCSCVQMPRAEADILYRVEEGPILLIQSSIEPDWERLDLPDSALAQPPQSKAFDPQCEVGQRLAFRLRCRPTKKVKVDGHKNSRFRYLRTDDERLEWLRKQGEKSGFRLESVVAIEQKWRDTKPSVDANAQGGRTALPAIQFDGILVVTDPERLAEAICKGIGPQKAYGFGLLSVARCE
jgi:CRISPR system Cascade subunit CasE